MTWMRLAIGLLMALAACRPTPEERTAATMPANAYPRSPVEPVTPPPSPVPRTRAPADLVLGPNGLGPLRIGMSRAEVLAAWGDDADPQAVASADPAQCDQFRPARAPQGVLVMIEDGRLTRISLIRGNPIRTDRSVGLGSTAAEVRAAYGGAATSSPHKYRDAPAAYLTVWTRKAVAGDQASPTDRGIVFEVDGAGVVDLVHAGGPSIRYVEGCL